MFMLENIPVMTSIPEIMNTLQMQLRLTGSHLLKDIKNTGTVNMSFTCPFHKSGMENTPSASITLRTVVRGQRKYPAGTFNCFTCHKHGFITELISHCFGKSDFGFGKQWILDNFNSFDIEERDTSIFHVPKRELNLSNKKYVSEEELSSYRFFHSYQKKRHLSDEIIEKFDIGYDAHFRLAKNGNEIPCITIPVRDKDGNCLFIARRSVVGKIFHYPSDADKPVCFQYEIEKMFPDAKIVWVCESLLNSLTLIQMGIPSVCLLGTGTSAQLKELCNMKYRMFVLSLDNDTAGIRGTQKLIDELKHCKLLAVFQLNEQGVDINDLGELSKDEFLKQGKYFRNVVDNISLM